jgi:hypothetical protein
MVNTSKFGKPVSAAAGFFYGNLKKKPSLSGKAFI